MAIAMKKWHARIHWMIAVELPPDFGEALCDRIENSNCAQKQGEQNPESSWYGSHRYDL